MTKPERSPARMFVANISAGAGEIWGIEFRGQEYRAREIRCLPPMRSVFDPTLKHNPRAFFVADAVSVCVRDGLAIVC